MAVKSLSYKDAAAVKREAFWDTEVHEVYRP